MTYIVLITGWLRLCYYCFACLGLLRDLHQDLIFILKAFPLCFAYYFFHFAPLNKVPKQRPVRPALVNVRGQLPGLLSASQSSTGF